MSRVVKILAPNDYPVWDRFVAASPQGSVFQTSDWIAVVAGQFNLRPEIVAVLEGDEIAGGIVLYHKTRMGIRIAAMPPATPYNGILYQDYTGKKNQKKQADEAEITELLLRRIEQEVQYAHFTLSPSIDDVRPFQWCAWNTRVQFTYINALEDSAVMWETLSPSLRRKITRAREDAFTISENGDIDTLIRLQEQSYARSAMRPVLDSDIYRRLCGELLQKRIVRIYSISDGQGSVHSARAIVLSGDTAFYWISGSQPVTPDDFASHVLLWEIFERLSKSGFTRFDFMGANTTGIVEFKRSFGGSLVNYYEVSWHRSGALKILVGANNLIQKLRRKK